MKILLRFSDNDRKGRDFEEIVELQEEKESLRLGRVSESNDIVLKSSSVSRQHAKIRVRHGALQVCDFDHWRNAGERLCAIQSSLDLLPLT